MTTSEWPLILDGERTSILSAPPARRPRVLVVEADSTVRRAVVQTLVDARYLTSAAADAAQALHLLDLEPYDVVVLAEDLGGTRGAELARTIRAWPSRWDIGLIGLTADSDAARAVALLEAGCDASLAKTATTAELTKLVREVARTRFQGVAATRGRRIVAA
jgi:DNA-binding response OmpR family regulator